jgi:catalase
MDNQNFSNQNTETSHSTTDSQSRVADDHYDLAKNVKAMLSKSTRQKLANNRLKTMTKLKHRVSARRMDIPSIAKACSITMRSSQKCISMNPVI